MKHLENVSFFPEDRKNINLFKTEMDEMKEHCVTIHTYIYYVGPFKHCTIDRLYWLGDNTSINHMGVLVLSPLTETYIINCAECYSII